MTMTSNIKVADGRKPETEPATFHYEKPAPEDRHGGIHLAETAQGSLNLKIISSGGENNLHAHRESDGFWFVLRGRVRFYTTDDELVAELGENEGMSTPRGYKYWFEAVPGDDELELMRFGVTTRPNVEGKFDRINHSELKANQEKLLAEKDELLYDLQASS
jgi:mannose-6-phosphate isomerase-like protein (cupin superfamily)